MTCTECRKLAMVFVATLISEAVAAAKEIQHRKRRRQLRWSMSRISM